MSAPQFAARIQWIVIVVFAAMLVMVLAIGAASGQSAAVAALGSAFTYQGQLSAGGAPANGAYDFQFRLFTAAGAGSQVGPVVEVGDVAVSGGAFAVGLDFGAVFDGQPRWLEIAVRPGAESGGYTLLSPRQALTAVPYALYAQAAQTATTSYLADVAEIAQTALSAQAAQTATTAYAADVAEIAQSAPETWSLTDVTTDYKTGRLQYSGFYYASDCVPGPCFEPLPEDAINKVGLGLAPKQVQAGAILVVTRTGEYTGSLLLELEARGFDGVYKRTVSAAPVSLAALPIGQLVDLPLSPVPANLLVLPNEYLAVRVHRSGAQAGDLVVWPAVYATVRNVQN